MELKFIHDFLFKPHIWIGEGKITFSYSPDFVKFYTRWHVQTESEGLIKAIQTVEMKGVQEHVVNEFTFKSITSSTFSVSLENDMVGMVLGKGILDPTKISWEFAPGQSIEGFEVYELQENGDYFLHAEYLSPDQYRNTIEGLIWKKSTEGEK